jgi:septum formation protein
MKTLYLASTSASRKMLLAQSKIPFTIIQQSADEAACDWNLPLEQVVRNIALYKMEHALVPQGQENDICYVLTADTLTLNSQGGIEGKPIDRQDAIKKLQSARNGARTGTAFCLDRRLFKHGAWHIQERVVRFVQADYQFNVPDNQLDFYLDTIGFWGSCAIAIEDFGAQFLETVNGSYTTIVGLPMYELRQELTKLGFFS